MYRMRRLPTRITANRLAPRRSGAATVDLVLLMGLTMVLAGAALYELGRLLRAAYELSCALISWPFL